MLDISDKTVVLSIPNILEAWWFTKSMENLYNILCCARETINFYQWVNWKIRLYHSFCLLFFIPLLLYNSITPSDPLPSLSRIDYNNEISFFSKQKSGTEMFKPPSWLEVIKYINYKYTHMSAEVKLIL